MAHALLSASGAHRWMACTPSARLEEPFPESASTYAEEGTLAHAMAETLCSYNARRIKKTEYTKRMKDYRENPLCNKEMEDYITDFAAYVWEQHNAAKVLAPDALLLLEERLDFSEYVPGGFGTGDVVIVSNGWLDVIDLKYGKGVPVSAQENEQLMLYALGALWRYGLIYGIEWLRLTIYQPRLDNISRWEVPVKMLLDWAETLLKPKAALAFDGAGNYAPGDHCRFCKAKAVCRARAEENLKLAKYDFCPPNVLGEEEIADVLKVAENLKNWAENVAAYALEEAVKGRKWNGWKLVEGRSNREYGSPDRVAEVLTANDYNETEIYNKKLKGITEMEKLLGKKKFEEYLGAYIVKPAGKPALVQLTDPRPELSTAAAAAEDFKEFIEN